MLVCDKCSASISAGSIFCAQCGDLVTEADNASQTVTSTGTTSVQITFGNSTSASYAKAISICEKLPSYVVSGEGKQAEHKITLPLTEVELIANIFDLVGSWKSSQMLINGQPATKKDLSYYGIGCYRNRQKAYKPEAFCYGERQHEANIWGCKKLGFPVNEWGGGWLDYGSFESNGVWRFDKTRIRHELEVALNENKLCPVLDRCRVIETLDRLPETLSPKTDKNWEYRTSYENINGSFKEVVIGIRPVLKKVNRYIIGDFTPDWEEDPKQVNVSRVQLKTNAPRSASSSSHKRTRKQNSRGCLTSFIFLVLFFSTAIFGVGKGIVWAATTFF